MPVRSTIGVLLGRLEPTFDETLAHASGFFAIPTGTTVIANETITVGATAFTFKASATANTEITIGSTTAATRANIAAAVNAHPTTGAQVYAWIDPDDFTKVKFEALSVGTAGNAIALAETVAAAGFTRSAATLAGGLGSTFSTTTDSILIGSLEYQVDASMLDRNLLRNTLSPIPHTMGRKIAKVRFTTELRGNGLQGSGIITDAPVIGRLLQACGYAATAMATAESVSAVRAGNTGTTVTWGSAGGTPNPLGRQVYELECTTGGATGVAQIKVNVIEGDDTGNNAATVTNNSAFTIGAYGLTLTPTFTGSLAVGDRWLVTLYPKCIKYTPISTNVPSIAFEAYFDGVKHLLSAAYGTFTVTAEAGGLATVQFEFTGRYYDAFDRPVPTVTNETTQPSQVELARLNIDGYYPIVQSFNFTQGNQLVERDDMNKKDGFGGMIYASRAPTGGINPEATYLREQNFWTRLSNATKMTFAMRVGTAKHNMVLFDAPQAQYTGLQYQDRNTLKTYDAGLKFATDTADNEVVWRFA